MKPQEIRGIRQALKLTQHELGQLIGAHAVSVCRWERGHYTPSAFQEAILNTLAHRKSKGSVIRIMLQERGPVQALGVILSP